MHRYSLVWNSLTINLKMKPSFQSFKKETAKQSNIINSITFDNTALGKNKDIDNFVY